eukprot:CAMPEP_0197516648 /NCGR_PEP_ID=MMETSP1318-20131121/1511_1 /TAXON_ID=552666 /ORGANISM="Partenskyella glossopodia, Strain RCC365" /LENGTH=71 /DNA_ID=CAMNT_0043065525 /DNA_START=173 /DNA_END=388 /DNA_ORIENTATION=+
MDRIYSAEQIQVPPMLPGIMKAWTKEVIRCGPEDIVKFSKEYFSALDGGKIEDFLKKEHAKVKEEGNKSSS